jgi:hypothetical protein
MIADVGANIDDPCAGQVDFPTFHQQINFVKCPLASDHPGQVIRLRMGPKFNAPAKALEDVLLHRLNLGDGG